MQLDAGVIVTVAPPEHPKVGVTPPVPSAVTVLPSPGRPGLPGKDAAAVTGFTYVQTTPAASWPVVHNLGRHPYAVLCTVGGSEVIADIDFPDLNTLVITHALPVSGRVDLV